MQDMVKLPHVRVPAIDPINRPAHYMGRGLEAVDVLEAWGLGPHLWNAGKYILRAGKKGPATEDLGKALWYARRALQFFGNGNALATCPMGITTAQVTGAFALSYQLGQAMGAIWDIADANSRHEVATGLTRLIYAIESEIARLAGLAPLANATEF